MFHNLFLSIIYNRLIYKMKNLTKDRYIHTPYNIYTNFQIMSKAEYSLLMILPVRF